MHFDNSVRSLIPSRLLVIEQKSGQFKRRVDRSNAAAATFFSTLHLIADVDRWQKARWLVVAWCVRVFFVSLIFAQRPHFSSSQHSLQIAARPPFYEPLLLLLDQVYF